MAARVYSYTRFSDAKQAAGASSDRQGAYAAKWAEDHGLVLDAELSMRDEGLSAFHQRHVTKGALGVFLRAVEDGKVAPKSVLIVEGLDRLSRADPIDAQAQLTQIITAGISVVTAEDGKVYNRANLKANPFDLIHSLLKMIRANEESETKSRRVRDALRRQCVDWVSGKSRRLVRFGNSPGWLRVVDGKWELIPERAEAITVALDLFRRGMGAGQIANHLADKGMSVSDGEVTSGHLLRLFAQPALYGEKRIELDGETFTLEGYYPTLIDREGFAQIQDLGLLRGRKGVAGTVPPVLTGIGVTYCGYCGSAMKSQTMTNKMRPDGSLSDGHRRLQCIRVNTGGGCSEKGSCSAAPIERALMRYCSDLVNIELLYGGDRSALVLANAAAAHRHLAKIEKSFSRMSEAIMLLDTPIPTFTKKAAELQAELVEAQRKVKDAEAAVLLTGKRAELSGADGRWRKLIKGVDGLDVAARMQARQLVADTFERIEVYHHGVNPRETPKGLIDVVLLAKGGVERMLRIDSDGNWVASEDADKETKLALAA